MLSGEVPPTYVAPMQLTKFSFTDTHAFNSSFLDYIRQKETLRPFYKRFPTPENFSDQIIEKQKSFPASTREILVKALSDQYKDLSTSEFVLQNIASLKDANTFTVTTGHQLNIFTGPLYFIYKIVTVINTCKQLKKDYPDYHFVPVYWMASEDHDYDEIKSFRLYGKKYIWKTDQTGAVGRFTTTGLDALLNEISGDLKIFQDAYRKYKTLSEAVRYYVNALFLTEGLVVIDADDKALKSQIKDVISQDINEQVNKSLVEKTDRQLQDLGYKTQIYCRDINFFYLEKNLRSRIEKSNGGYKVVDTNITFTKDEINQLIDQHPERFSPNVILRPLYQEMILPNLAYVGGPAEVVYWLQLKNVFEHFNIPFPILMPRNFAMVIDHEVLRKFEKTGLELKDIFEEKNYLFNHWILKHSPRNLTVGIERSQVNELFDRLKERAAAIDNTLIPFVGAEGKRALNSLEKIERKFIRAEKRLHADKLRQIEFVKDRLFPKGSLQERVDNFLNFYQEDREFLDKLLQGFDPFDFRFNVLFV